VRESKIGEGNGMVPLCDCVSLPGMGEKRRERRARFVYQSSRVTARSTPSFHSYYTLITFSLSLFTITVSNLIFDRKIILFFFFHLKLHFSF
jgi:hypothetical protein